MKKYEVTVRSTMYERYDVEAKSKEEAEDKVWEDGIDPSDFTTEFNSFDSTTEVKKFRSEK